jgi:hypothetical protein
MDGEMAGFYRDTDYSFLARPNPDPTDPAAIDTKVNRNIDF